MATLITAQVLKDRAPVMKTLKNNTITDAIDQAVRWVNEAAWGSTPAAGQTYSRYDDGVFYMACHLLAEDAIMNAAPSPAASGSAGAAGPKTAEGTQSWNASWATSSAFDDDALATTKWGQRFISLRNLVFSDRCL